MQYSILIGLFSVVIVYLAYRALRYRKRFASIFIDINEKVLVDAWHACEKDCTFESFRECWLAMSRKIDCPDGKMLANMQLKEIMGAYPLPEQLLDDLVQEEQISDPERPISEEAPFSELVRRCCSARSSPDS